MVNGEEVLGSGNRLFGTSEVRSVINEDSSPVSYRDVARAIGVVPLQLFAYQLARARGFGPGQTA
jgi:hypothetical protein